MSDDISTVGEAVDKYETHKEISHGSAVGSESFVNLEKQWNDTKKSADPNDNSVAAKFKEEVFEPWAENFKKGFTTENSQKYAESLIEKYRSHFDTKTAADMSSMAGQAATLNAHKLINSSASAVYDDPSSLATVLDVMKHSVGSIVGSIPTIDAETGAKITGELLFKGQQAAVMAAGAGYVAKNPNFDLDGFQKKYGEFIPPGGIKTLQKAAQTQAKVDAYHDKSAAVQQRQLDDLNVHKGATDTITKNVSVDQNGKPIINPQFFKDTLDLARKNPDAPSAAATVRTMLDWGESQLNKENKAVDNPAAVKTLTDRLFDPDKPLTELDLMRASTKGEITDHTYTKLKGMISDLEKTPLQGPVYQDTMKAAHDQLVVNVPGIPGKDTIGTQNYSSFVQSFVPQYLAKSRAGTLPPNALDTKDPTSMISQAMAPFKRTPSQRMQDYVAGAGGLGGGEPPKPAPVVTPPTKVSTPADANKLPAGTRYQTPDGKVYVR